MKDFWEKQYSNNEFIYGESPNEYLKSRLTNLEKGKILMPAEGEGRNAVYAAKLGWSVSAFDQSNRAKAKAEFLARNNNVTIDYIVSNVEDVDYTSNYFDALALIYAHFHSDMRSEYHQKLTSYLKEDGILILEAFGKQHVNNQKTNPFAGGPKDKEMLYELSSLKLDFKDFDFLEASETKTVLKEGKYHSGKANLIRLFAIKRKKQKS